MKNKTLIIGGAAALGLVLLARRMSAATASPAQAAASSIEAFRAKLAATRKPSASVTLSSKAAGSLAGSNF